MTPTEELAQAVLDGRVRVRALAVIERGVTVATDYAITVNPPPTPTDLDFPYPESFPR